jgi:hypothetical protein
MKIPSSVPIMSDWYLDPGYSEETKQLLADCLDDAITEWMKEAYLTCQHMFERQPNRKCAIRSEIGRPQKSADHEPMLINGEPVWSLFLLICGRSEVRPYQSVVCLGTRSFIFGYRDQIMTQFTEQLSASGIEADIVEEDLSGY